MEFLQALQNLPALTIGFYFLAFLVALVLIVFVHEFGHFIVGRLCGVKVEAFSIGFGKEMFGFTDRYGTRWKFCPILVGGYVRFEGDANAASMPDLHSGKELSPTSLHAQPVWERAAIVAAGPAANFVFAIALMTVALMVTGTSYMRPVVSEIVAKSAAEKAGLAVGDVVKLIDGKEIGSFEDIQQVVVFKPGDELSVVVERAGAPITLSIVPDSHVVKDNFGGELKIGVLGLKHNKAPDEPLFRSMGAADAFRKACDKTWFTVTTTLRMLGKIIIGQQSFKQISGPVSIAKGAGDSASGGVPAFINFIIFLSISIGIVNLFPIPMLDGGHLVFYAIEALRGKPVGPQAQEWGFRIGFSCVVMLMLMGLFNDMGRVINVVFGT